MKTEALKIVEYSEGFAIIETSQNSFVYTKDDRIIDLPSLQEQPAKIPKLYSSPSFREAILT